MGLTRVVARDKVSVGTLIVLKEACMYQSSFLHPQGRIRRPRNSTHRKPETQRRKSVGSPIGSRGGFDSRELRAGAEVEARTDALKDPLADWRQERKAELGN